MRGNVKKFLEWNRRINLFLKTIYFLQTMRYIRTKNVLFFNIWPIFLHALSPLKNQVIEGLFKETNLLGTEKIVTASRNSSLSAYLLPFKSFFKCCLKSQKSLGVKSGLYGGWRSWTRPASAISPWATLLVCIGALSF